MLRSQPMRSHSNPKVSFAAIAFLAVLVGCFSPLMCEAVAAKCQRKHWLRTRLRREASVELAGYLQL